MLEPLNLANVQPMDGRESAQYMWKALIGKGGYQKNMVIRSKMQEDHGLCAHRNTGILVDGIEINEQKQYSSQGSGYEENIENLLLCLQSINEQKQYYSSHGSGYVTADQIFFPSNADFLVKVCSSTLPTPEPARLWF